MWSKIKITIITATYDSGLTLEQTISSVVEQKYNNIEYIIIDGKSSDDTVDIIKKYESYGIKWISEPDDGLYDALNKGIAMATGDYFMILGSDDSLVSKDTISNVVASIDADTDILSAAVIVVDEKYGKQYPAFNHFTLDKENYIGGMIPHQGMFVRTSLGRKYPFDTSYKITADYKFFLQCYYDDAVKFKFIDELVVFFANNGVSSDLAACHAENNRIYKELDLPFHDSLINSRSLWKNYIKRGLVKLNLLTSALKFLEWWKCKFIWKKHHCDNKICRWCGRT